MPKYARALGALTEMAEKLSALLGAEALPLAGAAWNSTRHGIPPGTVSDVAWYPPPHGFPPCTSSFSFPPGVVWLTAQSRTPRGRSDVRSACGDAHDCGQDHLVWLCRRTHWSYRIVSYRAQCPAVCLPFGPFRALAVVARRTVRVRGACERLDVRSLAARSLFARACGGAPAGRFRRLGGTWCALLFPSSACPSLFVCLFVCSAVCPFSLLVGHSRLGCGFVV